MALVKCPGCEKEVSKKAESCPHCGEPIKKKKKGSGCGSLILLGALAFILFAVMYEPTPSANRSGAYESPPPPAEKQVKRFEITGFNWSADPDFGTDGAIIWNIEIKNLTENYIENVRVNFTTYDANKKLITSDFAYVKGLSPGGTGATKSYATYFGTEKTAKAQVQR